MKVFAIAAIALAGLTLGTASARADGSNCTAWNGPFCETAHNIRHHGWQLPIVWETPRLPWPHHGYPTPIGGYPSYPQGCYGGGLYGGHGGFYGGGTCGGYPPIVGGCAIQSSWGCRHRSPYHAGVLY